MTIHMMVTLSHLLSLPLLHELLSRLFISQLFLQYAMNLQKVILQPLNKTSLIARFLCLDSHLIYDLCTKPLLNILFLNKVFICHINFSLLISILRLDSFVNLLKLLEHQDILPKGVWFLLILVVSFDLHPLLSHLFLLFFLFLSFVDIFVKIKFKELVTDERPGNRPKLLESLDLFLRDKVLAVVRWLLLVELDQFERGHVRAAWGAPLGNPLRVLLFKGFKESLLVNEPVVIWLEQVLGVCLKFAYMCSVCIEVKVVILEQCSCSKILACHQLIWRVVDDSPLV